MLVLSFCLGCEVDRPSRYAEPTFSCGDMKAREAYRMVYAPSSPVTTVLRAEDDGQRKVLHVLEVDSEQPRVSRRATRELSQTEWEQLVGAIAALNFWNRTAYPSPTTVSPRSPTHGSAWILEALEGRSYYALSRTSLSREREFDAVAQALFAAAGIRTPWEFAPFD